MTDHITLNGERTALPDAGTVADLLSGRLGRPDPPWVAVAVNASVVPRSRWPRVVLQPGDVVEVVTAVQGG